MSYTVTHFIRDKKVLNPNPIYQEEVPDEEVPNEIARLFDSGLIHRVKLELVGEVDAVWEKNNPTWD